MPSRQVGSVLGPGRASPVPRGRRRGIAAAEGRLPQGPVRDLGRMAEAPGAGQELGGSGEPLSRARRGAALDGAAIISIPPLKETSGGKQLGTGAA